MAQIFLNNTYAVLNEAIDALSTVFTLRSPNGFPDALRAGDWFLMTLYSNTQPYGVNHEVIRVTALAHNADGTVTVTAERGAELTAVPHAEREKAEGRVTAGTMDVVEKTRKRVMMMSLGINVL